MRTEVSNLGVLPIEAFDAGLDSHHAALASESSGLLAGVAQRLDESLSTPGDISAELSSAAEALRTTIRDVAAPTRIAAELRQVLDPIALGIDDPEAFNALVGVFERYDVYFGTKRLMDPDAQSMLVQTLETASVVLADIACCMMESNEIRSVVDGFAAVTESLCDRVSADSPVAQSVQPSAAAPESDLKSTVLRRWRLGHHAFNLFTTFATRELRLAYASEDEEQAIRHLHLATRCLRATTSAMWYAEASPRNVYANWIRPSMVEASGKDSGFSGTDNLEFRWFRFAEDALMSSLTARFDGVEVWSNGLYAAVWGFVETRHLDLEHHALLAEKVVGQEPSLLAIRRQEQSTRNSSTVVSAVQALRMLTKRVIDVKAELQ